MEEVRRLVPVDPHSAQVITEEIVQRVSGEEGQAVRDPVCLVRVVVKVGLGAFPEVPDCLGSLLVGARPNTQTDTIERVRGVLLEDESMVNAVWLAATGADLDIMREASTHSGV